MLTEKIRQNKILSAAFIAVIALAIILSGTFAWWSFNQRKQNIFHLPAQPNVNLHDDFVKGPKKDVYVENSGSIPVLVRVRMTELLSINNVISPPGATDGEYSAGWHIHKPRNGICNTCDFKAHNYYMWQMGGHKFYMPAHQSARGAYTEDNTYIEPIAVGDKKIIINYVTLLTSAFEQIYAENHARRDEILGYIEEYLSGDATNAAILKTEIEKIPDSFTVDNVEQYEGQPAEEHTRMLNEVRLTLIPSQIITMSDWVLGTTYGTPYKSGSFWVMDIDGWCYWAEPLLKNTATGQLLSSVRYRVLYSEGKTEYKIKVSLNATTFEDIQLGEFFLMAEHNGGITAQGELLMFLASGEYVLGQDSEIYMQLGNGIYRQIIKTGDTYASFTLGDRVDTVPGIPSTSGRFPILKAQS